MWEIRQSKWTMGIFALQLLAADVSWTLLKKIRLGLDQQSLAKCLVQIASYCTPPPWTIPYYCAFPKFIAKGSYCHALSFKGMGLIVYTYFLKNIILFTKLKYQPAHICTQNNYFLIKTWLSCNFPSLLQLLLYLSSIMVLIFAWQEEGHWLKRHHKCLLLFQESLCITPAFQRNI